MIRAAVPADLTGVAAIYAWYVEHTAVTFALQPPSEAEWLAQWERGFPWSVCELGERIVGYALADRFFPRGGYDPTIVTSIYLHRGHTGQGLGRPLYEDLLARCGDFHSAVAGITLPNEASVSLHEKLGFSRVGVFHEVGFKHGRRLDVGWWERRL